MNRLAALTLAAGLAFSLAVSAAEPTPQALLTDAILCKGDPLGTVRKMAESGSSHFDQGFAAATFGEEMDEMMDEVTVVILRSPLEIGGARTSAILLTLAQGEDFGALVYGRFRGDYKQAVKALKLAPTAKKDGLRLGHFTKAMAVDVDGRPDKVCPMTIALAPQEDGIFLLGCGWCNG
ncbi:MAG TPA: hypothetical protein VF179_17985 [Thermoanaerobaculia bacterium]|nr:hypothetical protein [Thermoanaerobaculia bacterium]